MDQSSTGDTVVEWTSQFRLRLPREQLWDLMWSSHGRHRWLGRDARLGLVAGRSWALTDGAVEWVRGRCRTMRRPEHVLVDLADTDVHDQGSDQSRAPTLQLDLAEDGDDTVVTVTQAVRDDTARDLVAASWAACLERLEQVVATVRAAREPGRQAVLVIHGIGEQEPGSTLSALVDSGVLAPEGSDTADRWVKPDLLSDSFELRRVQFDQAGGQPHTRVYELYWAHLLRDTTMGQVSSWLRGLLLRWPPPRTLRVQWWLAWLVVAVAAAIAVGVYVDAPWVEWFAFGAAAAVAFRVVWRLVGRVVALQVVGDAARYLVPRPANIANRQAIREAGVALLERMHESGLFDRIVVVGHSLGSVIAYDILTHAWIRAHRHHASPAAPSFTELRAMERAVSDGADADTAQQFQWDAWRRMRANTQRWLVTDLVTLGSPLAHADFLMAPSLAAFEQDQQDRVLPTCPPVTEVERASGHRRVSFEDSYDAEDGTSRTFTFLHHAAVFGVTRWTNLYFPVRWLGLGGDLVGGPVAPMFGPWVKDVELDSPWRGFAHTRYWGRGPDGRDAHLQALRSALHLQSRRELAELADEIPAASWLDS